MTRLPGSARLVLLLVLALIPAGLRATPARSNDGALLAVLGRDLQAVEEAGRIADAGRGGPDAVQRQYDAARSFDEALHAILPVSGRCRPLFDAAVQLARAHVTQAEGVDRHLPLITQRAVSLAAQARSRLSGARASCSPSPAASPTRRIPELLSPRRGEAFFGEVAATAPRAADRAELIANGRVVSTVEVQGTRFRVNLVRPPGRYTIAVRFLRDQTLLSEARSPDAYLLPAAAGGATGRSIVDARLSAAVASVGRTFGAYSGLWTMDLLTGATAGWNAETRFPAASTVKLGVLVAALDRFGPRPEVTRVAYDTAKLTAWSSNLASNRLLVELGGSESAGSAIAQSTLARLGATSSTFTGDYIVGTIARGPRTGEQQAPPIVSSRVTTAGDLGRILATIHAAAAGQRDALRRSGLTLHEARLALALLLRAEPTGDNRGLLSPSLSPGVPIAQKNGWISSALHTAAIVYGPSGPKAVVVLTYRPSIRRADAEALGARMLALAG